MRCPAVIPGPCCAALLAACAGPGHAARAPTPADVVVVERTVDLPPTLAAAIVGGALRRQLPFADPMPAAAGALATPVGAGQWRLAWQQRGHDLVAVGSHRLRVVSAPGDRLAAVGDRLDTAPGIGLAHYWLDIRRDRHGSRLVGTLRAGWVPAIDHALQLAADPTLPLPGLAEPNLAQLARHRLLADARASERRGEAATAARQRSAAAGLAGADASAYDDLAAIASAYGQHERANDQAWRAVLAADPLQRGRHQQRLHRSWLAFADAEQRAKARGTAAAAAAPPR